MKSQKTILGCLVLALFLLGMVAGCGLGAGGYDQQTLQPTDRPTPEACDQLGEQLCTARPDCEPVYATNGCACAPCLGGEDCLPCRCPEPEAQFVTCIEVDPCRNLPENQCVANPDCAPLYGTLDCLACGGLEPDPDGNGARYCECPDVEEFLGCYTPPVQCEPVACRAWCEYGFATDENGCEICACNPPPPGCSGLGEQECIANPSCEPTYIGYGCGCGACPPGVDCPPCDCAPEPEHEYTGCVDTNPPICPDILCDAVWCEYGYAVDENGCQTCECLPPPSGCDGLAEDQCVASPSCDPIYVGWGCACAECPPGESCPPCDCPPEPQYEYAGCIQIDPCTNHTETECIADPSCEPFYGEQPCGSGSRAPCHPDDPNCGFCEGEIGYLGCYSGPIACPAIGCDGVLCEYGYAIDSNGCQTCECLPPPPCPGGVDCG